MAGQMRIRSTCAYTSVGIAVSAFTEESLKVAQTISEMVILNCPLFAVIYDHEEMEGLLMETVAGLRIVKYTC